MLCRLHIEILCSDSVPFIHIPYMFFSWSIASPKAPDIIVYNNADIGHPCLIDLVILKSSVKKLLTN